VTVGAVTRERYARDLLARLGIPARPQAVVALVAWMAGENTQADWNPLATTMAAPGALTFNAAGVKRYPSYDAGLDATARTLRLRWYAPVLDALRRGAAAREVLDAVAASPWGTGQAAVRALRPTIASWPRAAMVMVTGPGPVPGPVPAGGDDMYESEDRQRDQQTHDAVARIESLIANKVLVALDDLRRRVEALEARG
jgi:hypothetical protein